MGESAEPTLPDPGPGGTPGIIPCIGAVGDIGDIGGGIVWAGRGGRGRPCGPVCQKAPHIPGA